MLSNESRVYVIYILWLHLIHINFTFRLYNPEYAGSLWLGWARAIDVNLRQKDHEFGSDLNTVVFNNRAYDMLKMPGEVRPLL